VVDTAICEICQQDKETAEHVIMGCQFAKEFWAKIGFTLPFVSSGVVGDFKISQCQVSSFLPSKTPQCLRSPFVVGSSGSAGMRLSSCPKQQAIGSIWFNYEL